MLQTFNGNCVFQKTLSSNSIVVVDVAMVVEIIMSILIFISIKYFIFCSIFLIITLEVPNILKIINTVINQPTLFVTIIAI